MKCGEPIATSIAPERRETVYCERCYREERELLHEQELRFDLDQEPQTEILQDFHGKPPSNVLSIRMMRIEEGVVDVSNNFCQCDCT